MTFIQPHKKKKFQYFIAALLLFFLASGGFYIFEYNELVSIRHDIKRMEKEINRLESENVDLKNDLYSLIDPGKLESVAMELGFFLDRNPGFLNLNR